jgi:hypothetical protein
MGGASREGSSPPNYPSKTPHTDMLCTGGKAKPLKAPKKEKKELDEEELAFREKQKAGKSTIQCAKKRVDCAYSVFGRCQSQQRDGRESERKGPTKRWTTRD